MPAQQPKKIIIIGGGIVGSATAYFLTRHASYDPELHSIVMLEASSIATASSGKAGGFLASWATPNCLAPLSFKLHQSLAQQHQGDELWGFRPVYAAEVELEADETDADNLHLPPRPGISDDRPSDLDWLLPGSVREYTEIGTPSDSAQVHPYLLTNKLAQLAEASGVAIVIGSATSIDYSPDGSSVASVTYSSRGETTVLEATDVLVAAGPWSSKLLPQVKLLAPKGHSIAIQPSKDPISPYILFPKIHAANPILSPEIYPRPKDTINDFETVYASGPGYYDVPLPDLAAQVTTEQEKCDDVWQAVRNVSQEIRDGKIIMSQACYKAQIRKHADGEEAGPVVGPMPVTGLWLATGLDEWGIQNGPGVGLVMSEFILEGRTTSASVEALDPKHWI
ncbi:FAD dependent oxidoreductase [Lasiosphaeria miniovina]|uniref:FAD dependent oxidoreductase n=1 Tax=Lasiosphaeria miniovina TaxID=1954250 RepID=A0AA40ATT7_9PEZI|nr:FAD dependent oxidoreductase [Lasiosphaeria miniovina]KAK0721799.1 FAD dependent oxidoreductase [Lasiosphaeria miniovina]